MLQGFFVDCSRHHSHRIPICACLQEFFKHCSAPMAFDPVKGRYLKIDAETNSRLSTKLVFSDFCSRVRLSYGLSGQKCCISRYIDCDVPHDPIEYSVSVSVGASLVGQTDEARGHLRAMVQVATPAPNFAEWRLQDLNAPDRPRTMLLKAAAMCHVERMLGRRLAEHAGISQDWCCHEDSAVLPGPETWPNEHASKMQLTGTAERVSGPILRFGHRTRS